MPLSVVFPLFGLVACRHQRIARREMECEIEAGTIDGSEIRIPESALADVKNACSFLLDHVAGVSEFQRDLLTGLRRLRQHHDNRIQSRSANLFLAEADMLEELNRFSVIRRHRGHSQKPRQIEADHAL